jgi:alpha-tubulin suppressor-like RCC1 family protein
MFKEFAEAHNRRMKISVGTGSLKQLRARNRWWRSFGIVSVLVAMVAGLPITLSAPTASAEQSEQPGSQAFASISAGYHHTCVIMSGATPASGGAVRCWGNNYSGVLGLGHTNTIGDDESPTTNVDLGGAKATAVAVGSFHSCALLVGGAVRCWGPNGGGELGHSENLIVGDDESPTVNVNLGGASATAITAQANRSCALLSTGSVVCWGSQYGATPTPIDLGGSTAVAVSSGGSNTCALLVGGIVRCWGRNHRGQLGLSYINNLSDNPPGNVNLGGATATAVSGGANSVCVLLTGGAVRCWGENAYGSLGLGHTDMIGDDESPLVNVSLGGQTAVGISLSGDHQAISNAHACVVLSGGAVRCWGQNFEGQLGLAHTNHIGDNETPAVNVNLGGTSAVALGLGATHTCAVLTGGVVRCWGSNREGRLGLGNATTIGDNESPTTNVDLGSGATVGGVDTTAPVVTITNTQLQPAAFTIQGSASDGGGIASVKLTIKRNNLFWNGNGFQAAAVTVPAVAAKPNSVITAWSYPIDAGPGPLAITATATDSAGLISSANLGTFVADPVPPTVSISAPTVNQLLASNPVTITGTAADNVGVAQVNLYIRRTIAGVEQLWDGTGWGSTAQVAATLANPNSTNTAWSYTFNPPQSGRFTVQAGVSDTSQNSAGSFAQSFSVSDGAVPLVSIVSPVNAQELVGRPVVISGTASDNSGVADTHVKIWRKLVDRTQYWNGSGWQNTLTTVRATMGSPGASTTTWTYSFHPPQSGGRFAVTATATDTFNRVRDSASLYFLLPDSISPSATIQSPSNGSTSPVNSGLIVTGTATDNVGISGVGLVIKRNSDNNYLNATGTWQPSFVTVEAFMTTSGEPSTTFSLPFTPPTIGTYSIVARPLDVRGNIIQTPATTITAT